MEFARARVFKKDSLVPMAGTWAGRTAIAGVSWHHHTGPPKVSSCGLGFLTTWLPVESIASSLAVDAARPSVTSPKKSQSITTSVSYWKKEVTKEGQISCKEKGGIAPTFQPKTRMHVLGRRNLRTGISERTHSTAAS